MISLSLADQKQEKTFIQELVKIKPIEYKTTPTVEKLLKDCKEYAQTVWPEWSPEGKDHFSYCMINSIILEPTRIDHE